MFFLFFIPFLPVQRKYKIHPADHIVPLSVISIDLVCCLISGAVKYSDAVLSIIFYDGEPLLMPKGISFMK
jgi:hypothetical protein